jgi:FKBP-type peptidyl-prolyl cis-trans isomerase FkpA
MKRYLYLLLVGLSLTSLSSCKKGDLTSQQSSIDDAKIQAYIKANNITAVKDPSGLYYQIIKDGTGSYPTAKSNVQVTSVGRLLNGTVFDQHSVITFQLNTTIQGWQIGLLHVKSGTLGSNNTAGRILLLVPSALGYGNVAQTAIPANSVLIFTVDLIGYY